MKTLIYHYTPLSKHLIADLFDIYIFTSGILYLILSLTSYTHVIFILLANNLTHSSTWNYICTCKLWHVLHHWSFQHEQKLPPDFFRQDAEFFFFYLYIHVYIYMFIYTYLFCFWKRKMKKKNVSVENTKWWKKNLAAVIYFLLPDPDDVCLISAGNSELSKTSSY